MARGGFLSTEAERIVYRRQIMLADAVPCTPFSTSSLNVQIQAAT
mgnify:CR=1 FL=1